MTAPRSEPVADRALRLGLAARLARREVSRRPARALLVALLVALPVAAMMLASVMVRTEHLSPEQYWANQYGRADVVLQATEIGVGRVPPPNASLQAVLRGGRVVTERTEPEGIARTVAGRRSEPAINILPMNDPITTGMFRVTSGRVPTASHEVFLTSPVAHDFGVGVGQDLRLAAPVRQTFRVVGVGDAAADFSDEVMVFPPATSYPWKSGNYAAVVRLVDPSSEVSVSNLERVEVAQRAGQGDADWAIQVGPRLIPQSAVFVNADAQRKVQWSWVLGAVVLTITGIVIAAAFAVGARRQLVTLAQLAGSGASPRQLYWILLLQGTWTGIFGVGLGLGLGVAALVALRSRIDDIFGHATGGYIVRLSDLVPIVVLGVVAATVAAAIPARTASRIPLLSAFAGRRPLGRVPRWLPISGAAAVAVGLALFGLAVEGTEGGRDTTATSWMVTAIIGCMAVLLGACAITPSLVSNLESTAQRTRGAWRLATRSLARQRTRTGAVVAAIAATSALAIAASALVLGQHAARDHKARWIAPDRVDLAVPRPNGNGSPPPALVNRVAHVLPGAERISIPSPRNTNLTWTLESVVPFNDGRWGSYPGTGTGQAPAIAIANDATMDLFRLSGSDRRALARDGWLVFGESKGHVVFDLGIRKHLPAPTVTPLGSTVDAVMLPALDHEIGSLAEVLVSPARAAQLGISAVPGAVVLRLPHALTRAQRLAVEEIAPTASVFTPAKGVDPLLIQWALVGVALALVLFVVAVNLALSAAETRDERDVLTIVGAGPGAMARTNGYKAAVLTVMGAALAIPIGFLPIAVYVHGAPGVIPLEFPWRVVALLLIALPLVGGILMTAASGFALRLRPVRISTMAYE